MGVEHQSTNSGYESGYASGNSSTDSLPVVVFSKPHLKFLNNTLNELQPMDILRWAKITFPNLYQTTAFGVSGLVTLDMLSKLQAETPSAPSIDGIFLDTLYHFQETLDLVEKAKARYPNVNLHVYKPEGVNTVAEFEAKHGKELWKTNADLYDWVAKVEPAQRAYSDLSVAAVLTGRRRSQGAKRESLDIIEVTDEGLIKINPLAGWSFKQVEEYIKSHNVPYNELLNRGYKSVGDWHSTEPVKEGEDERAGRWKGQAKTECGIHNKKSKYALFLMEQEQKRQQEELTAALEKVEIEGERLSEAKEETPVEAQVEAAEAVEVVLPVEATEETPVEAPMEVALPVEIQETPVETPLEVVLPVEAREETPVEAVEAVLEVALPVEIQETSVEAPVEVDLPVEIKETAVEAQPQLEVLPVQSAEERPVEALPVEISA
jgi:phosphoadenosine phosphosulfate reductase